MVRVRSVNQTNPISQHKMTTGSSIHLALTHHAPDEVEVRTECGFTRPAPGWDGQASTEHVRRHLLRSDDELMTEPPTADAADARSPLPEEARVQPFSRPPRDPRTICC